MQSALQKDIDAMESVVNRARDQATAGGAPTVPGQGELPGEGFVAAWGKFKEGRAGYARYAAQEARVEAQAIEQMFGMSPRDPEAAVRKLLTMEPAEQARAINLLRQNFPESLDALKAWKLEDVLRRGFSQAQEGKAHGLRANDIISELTNGKGVAGADGGLWSRSELKDIEATVAYLRLIQSRSQLKDGGVEAMRVFMALVSRSGAFMAGAGWRIFGNPGLEQRMFSEEGRRVLSGLAKAEPGGKAWQSLVGSLQAMTITDAP